MQTTTTAYKQAVTNAERTPVADVRVDWLRSGNPVAVDAASVRVNRSIVADFDPSVTLIAGHSVAQADMELTGDPNDNTATAGALYSPYKATAALADVDPEGLPVTVKLGVVAAGQDPLTVFVGSVRELAVAADSDGTTGTMQAFDAATSMANSPTLPLVVAADVTNGVQPGLNSQWVASNVLRGSGYYTTPRARWKLGSGVLASFNASMNGSATPDIDSTTSGPLTAATASGGPLEFTPVKFGLGLKPDPVDGSAGTARYRPLLLSYSFSAILIEMWMIPTVVSYPTGDISIRDLSNTAGSRLRLGHDGANYILRMADTTDVVGPAVTTPTTAHYVAAYVEFSGGSVTVTWRIDSTTTVSTPVASPMTTTPDDLLVKTFNAIEGLQVAGCPLGGVPGGLWNNAFVPTAVLEPGENDLVAMPAIPAKTPGWQVLQDLASAEAGVVLFDEQGTPRFWSRKHWGTASAATTVQRTINAATALKGVTISRTGDRIRNVISVPYTPVSVQPLSVIWALNAEDFVKLPPGGTATRAIDLSPAQAYRVDNTPGVIASGGALVNGHSGYRASRTKDGTGAAVGNIGMSVIATATSIRITWANPNAFAVWLVTPAGSGFPAGSVGVPTSAVVGQLINSDVVEPDTGTSVTASVSAVEARWQPSIDVYGERLLEVSASVWRQTAAVADALGQDLLHSTAWPCPLLDSVTVVGDAALQLGDRVQIRDDSGLTGLDEPAWVVEKTDKFGGGAGPLYEQELTLRLVGRPRQLLLGVLGRSELGGASSRL